MIKVKADTYKEFVRKMERWKRFDIFALIFTCVALPWLISVLHTWCMGVYHYYNIALCGTVTCVLLFVAGWLLIPGGYLYKGRGSPEFHKMWLSAFYEIAPRWVKSIVDRSCAEHQGSSPDLELVRIAKKLRKIGLVFYASGFIFAILTLYLLKAHSEDLAAIYYLNMTNYVMNTV